MRHKDRERGGWGSAWLPSNAAFLPTVATALRQNTARPPVARLSSSTFLPRPVAWDAARLTDGLFD